MFYELCVLKARAKLHSFLASLWYPMATHKNGLFECPLVEVPICNKKIS